MHRWQRAIVLVVLGVQLSEAARLGQLFAGRPHGLGLVPRPPLEARLRASASNAVKEAYFEQPLDQFDSSIKTTWKQRYQAYEDLYKPGGPIFVMIGGEGAIDSGWLTYGQMYQNAKAHNALVFQPEHRFYGESHPTSDLSVENMKYLSSVQALADLDAFIKGMKVQYKIPDAKVVVFGGSYPGDLVVWYRELYPQSSVGGIASSAPVLAEVDFTQYIETVGYAQKFYDPDCYDAVSDGYKAIQDLVAAKNDEKLNSLFGICGTGKLNYDDKFEVQTFYSGLVGQWMGTTQYNAYGNNSGVAQMCKLMSNEKYGEPIDRLSKLSKLTGGSCIDPDYKTLIADLKLDSWDSPYGSGGTRQWLWQTCTEFAFYQSTDSKDQPFGYQTVTADYYEYVYCNQSFGGISDDQVASSVTQANKRYGGTSPNDTNVFLFNGSIDPWHTLGIYGHDLNPSSPSRFIEGTSHCYDMYEARADDPPDLTKARQEAADIITKWLSV